MKIKKNTKIKKIFLICFVVMIVLSASLLRIVPNYANKYGFEIVHLWDYNKYNQGYCLAENRILDKEELYKRAINEYMKKDKEIMQKVYYILKTVYSYNSEPEKTQLYLVDTFNSSNWYEFLTQNNDNNKSYVEIANAKIVDDLYDNIVVDTQNDIVGFKKPIMFDYHLYLDKSFIIRNRDIEIVNIWFDDIEKDKHIKEKYQKWISQKDTQTQDSFEYFDNCGNTILDVETSVDFTVETYLHPG